MDLESNLFVKLISCAYFININLLFSKLCNFAYSVVIENDFDSI